MATSCKIPTISGQCSEARYRRARIVAQTIRVTDYGHCVECGKSVIVIIK